MTQTADLTSAEIGLRAAAKGVVLARPPMPGILRMTGEDALDLLDRLSTNAVVENAPGFRVSTVLTTNKGRVVDLLTVLYMADHWLVLTSPDNQQRVIDWIDGFTFGEEIELEDVTGEKGIVMVVGPRAAEVMSSATGEEVDAFSPHNCVETTIGGAEALVYGGGVGLDGACNVMAPSDSVESVCSALLAAGEGMGIREMDPLPFEAYRIASGSPAYGKELGEDVNPLEAGLWEAVNFSKGCYVGQEVVARLNTYEKVKRYLARLNLEGGGIPDAGTILTVDGKDAGHLTSVSPMEVSGASAAMGYVRKKYAQPGTKLTVETEQGTVVCEFVERVGARDEG